MTIECAALIDQIRIVASFIIAFISVLVLVMMWTLKEPGPRRPGRGELCKLHQRTIEDCKGMHDTEGSDDD